MWCGAVAGPSVGWDAERIPPSRYAGSRRAFFPQAAEVASRSEKLPPALTGVKCRSRW